MRFFEPFGNRDVLGAEFFALMADNTFVRLVVGWKLPVAEPGRARVIVHDGIIVKFEDSRDFYPAGAGRAVLAAGAGNRTQPLIFFPQLINKRQLLIIETARPGCVCTGKIFNNMLHGRHPAEHNGHFRLIPDPLQCPVSG